jgi:hypothetical protein
MIASPLARASITWLLKHNMEQEDSTIASHGRNRMEFFIQTAGVSPHCSRPRCRCENSFDAGMLFFLITMLTLQQAESIHQ